MSKKPLAFTAGTYLCNRCGKRWEDAALGKRMSDAMQAPPPTCGTRVETFRIDGVETMRKTVPESNGQCIEMATCCFFKEHL
jgi:hypothetical protein